MNDLIDYRLQYNPNSDIARPSPMNGKSPQTSDNRQLSLSSEPSIHYNNYEYYINISSNNRDSTNYPLHYDYRINFDFPYKNIKSIELISVILPNQTATSSGGNILNEPYFIIDIDELNYIEFPNNTSSKALKGFGIIPLKGPTQTVGGFINPELGCIYNTSKIYKTPLASLNYLTIKIRDINGDLYDFGQTNGSTLKQYQNSFVFKITTEEVSRKILNHRNVF